MALRSGTLYAAFGPAELPFSPRKHHRGFLVEVNFTILYDLYDDKALLRVAFSGRSMFAPLVANPLLQLKYLMRERTKTFIPHMRDYNKDGRLFEAGRTSLNCGESCK